MSKARLVITAVTVEGLSQGEAARRYEVSQGWVSKLMARYRDQGEAAFEPRSRRPKISPNALSPGTAELIVRLRKDLAGQGLDAGPHTIGWHLEHHHRVRVPAATFSRTLARQGLVTPAPAKRPSPPTSGSPPSCPTSAGSRVVGDAGRPEELGDREQDHRLTATAASG